MKVLAAMVISLSLLALGCANEKRQAASGSGAPPTASSEDSRAIKITRSGSQPSQQGPAEHFTGSVRIDPLFPANDPSRTSAGSVTFEPGARSAWHTHPLGQTLIVTAGSGWVQQEGGEKQEIKPGDVIWTPPGVKHWHGATATDRLTHIAIQESLDGKNVEWMEKVSDEQYQARLSGSAVVAQTEHITPFTGTWKLNLTKSRFNPGPPFKSFTLTFTPDGTRKLDLIYADGQSLKASLPWSAGKEVPVTANQGFENATATSKILGRTFDDQWKQNGKIIEKVHAVVSSGGRALTIAVDGTNSQGRAFHNHLIFEKQ